MILERAISRPARSRVQVTRRRSEYPERCTVLRVLARASCASAEAKRVGDARAGEVGQRFMGEWDDETMRALGGRSICR